MGVSGIFIAFSSKSGIPYTELFMPTAGNSLSGASPNPIGPVASEKAPIQARGTKFDHFQMNDEQRRLALFQRAARPAALSCAHGGGLHSALLEEKTVPAEPIASVLTGPSNPIKLINKVLSEYEKSNIKKEPLG